MFDNFREAGANTYYGSVRSAAHVDKTLISVIYACVIMALVVTILVLGSRAHERWLILSRSVCFLPYGPILIVCITGQFWLTGHVRVTSEDITSTADDVTVDIGLRVGLRDINISLTAPVDNVDYNEGFSLRQVNGLIHGLLEAKSRGLPQPITDVLEVLAMDDGGMHWGRQMRLAGHFTSITLGAAFISWLLSIILLTYAFKHGLVLHVVTGVATLFSCLLFSLLLPPPPHPASDAPQNLTIVYGSCFWLCLVCGIVCLVVGVTITVVYVIWPGHVRQVFVKRQSLVSPDDTDIDDVDQNPLVLDTPFTMRKRQKMASTSRSAMNIFDCGDASATVSPVTTLDAHPHATRWSSVDLDLAECPTCVTSFNSLSSQQSVETIS